MLEKLRGPFLSVLLGGLCLALAFPPIGFWPLAIVAAAIWTDFALKSDWNYQRPWIRVWLGAWATNLILFQFVRLPHWSTYFGWLILCAYLSTYLVLYIWLVRELRKKSYVAAVLAAPLIWIGLEYLRAHLLTGFAMGLVGHAVFKLPRFIQIADLGGAYFISGVLLALGVGLAAIVHGKSKSEKYVGILLGSIYFAITMAYGSIRVELPIDDKGPRIDVAIVQGSVDTVLERDQTREVHREYRDLTQSIFEGKANSAKRAELDLIIWPESKLSSRVYVGPIPLEELSDDRQANVAWMNLETALICLEAQGLITEAEFEQWIRVQEGWEVEHLSRFRSWWKEKTKTRGRFVPMLVGGVGFEYTEASSTTNSNTSSNFLNQSSSARFFNCAFLIEDAEIKGVYKKNHLVLCGEYWPILGGLTAGSESTTFQVKDFNALPNVCFESTVPHYVRNQVANSGLKADLIVNVSDDGWFWGSNALDYHLACNTLRAVENGTPTLIAANTGLSGFVYPNGKIVELGKRRERQVLEVTARKMARPTTYTKWGDILPLIAAGLVSFLIMKGVWGWRQTKSVKNSESSK